MRVWSKTDETVALKFNNIARQNPIIIGCTRLMIVGRLLYNCFVNKTQKHVLFFNRSMFTPATERVIVTLVSHYIIIIYEKRR